MPPFKIVGINFDHMHMGDLLRKVQEHPNAEIVGICDERAERMASTAQALAIPTERIFTDYRQCLEQTQPDMAILCPATATHGLWVERVAPYGVHLLVEKPFAASLAEADAMIAAVAATGKQMIINWPLAWYPPHVTSKRLLDEGVIGEVIEVHYYDGNRGPMRHVADKVEISPEEAARRKGESWFYQRAQGGGSLLDYLGYGVTLGTWFHNGDKPLEVTAVMDEPPGLEVDEHSITIARYAKGLSKYETRWGTFTDPWKLQPQPKCGFVIVGTAGTISSYDYEPTIRVQTVDRPEGEVRPVDRLQPPYQNPIQNFIHSLQTGEPVHGPLSPAICRIGQQIVDTAILSAREGRTVALLG
ncbi:MAG: Gfo/Idh/MocA family oxidoreductase [Caldilineaceae bacterium]|nr:Gfo/Idh/MocA family oxidoreductase [Caldilineaceae bacterium]